MANEALAAGRACAGSAFPCGHAGADRRLARGDRRRVAADREQRAAARPARGPPAAMAGIVRRHPRRAPGRGGRRCGRGARCRSARPAALAAGLRPARRHARVGLPAPLPRRRARALHRGAPGFAGRGVRRGAHEARRAGERGDEHERAAATSSSSASRRPAPSTISSARSPTCASWRRSAPSLWQEAAHDLRGNLGVVSNVAHGLAFRDLPADRRDEFVALLSNNVTALRHLLDDVTVLAACRRARKSGASLRSMPPTCCAACATTCGRSPMRRSCRSPATDRRRCRSKATPSRCAGSPRTCFSTRSSTPRAGRVVLSWGEAAPGDARRWRLSVEDSGPGFHAGPGAPIVDSLDPAVANEALDEAPDSQVAVPGDADERPINQSQARGPGPGDRQAPLRPARRHGRDRHRGRERHDSPRPPAAPLRPRPERVARGARRVRFVAPLYDAFTASAFVHRPAGRGDTAARRVAMDT